VNSRWAAAGSSLSPVVVPLSVHTRSDALRWDWLGAGGQAVAAQHPPHPIAGELDGAPSAWASSAAILAEARVAQGRGDHPLLGQRAGLVRHRQAHWGREGLPPMAESTQRPAVLPVQGSAPCGVTTIALKRRNGPTATDGAAGRFCGRLRPAGVSRDHDTHRLHATAPGLVGQTIADDGSGPVGVIGSAQMTHWPMRPLAPTVSTTTVWWATVGS
jgi:hypothetical protein